MDEVDSGVAEVAAVGVAAASEAAEVAAAVADSGVAEVAAAVDSEADSGEVAAGAHNRCSFLQNALGHDKHSRYQSSAAAPLQF